MGVCGAVKMKVHSVGSIFLQQAPRKSSDLEERVGVLAETRFIYILHTFKKVRDNISWVCANRSL